MDFRGWAWVLAGGVLEAVYPAILGMSEGMTELTATVVGFAFSVLATVLLGFGLKYDVPMGPAYAVWVGIGVAGSVLIDLAFFGKVFGIAAYLCLFLIFAGVVGLNLLNNSADRTAE